jgi:(R,R)-butanediol dehydrogenase/meso-butanediol dehydrogenase/diacetyl reductase
LQGQVLVKVRACSICGTDLHSYRLGEEEILARVPEGQTKKTHGFYGAIGNLRGGGHQIAGDIVEIGPDTSKWSVGDRVAGVAAGGYAEYCNMDRIYRLPDALSYEEGSYVEPLAVGVAAVRRSGIRLGDTAVVLGAGPIGQFPLQCAKAAGAMVIVTEVAPKRIELAKMFADEVVNVGMVDAVKRVRELTRGDSPSVIFECAGRDETMKQLIEMAGEYWTPYGQQTRGVIASLFEKPWAYDLFGNNALFGKNLELIGSLTYYPYGHPEVELKIAIDLMKRGRVKIAPLITAKIPLDDIDEGFRSLLHGEELGVVVQP